MLVVMVALYYLDFEKDELLRVGQNKSQNGVLTLSLSWLLTTMSSLSIFSTYSLSLTQIISVCPFSICRLPR